MPDTQHVRFSLDLVDAHAGGDVSRQVLAGIAPLPGDTLLAQLEYLRHEADGLRKLLLSEPYGAPAQCVNLVVPAVAAEAEAGFITMEAMGYPYFSGSNTLCTASVLLNRKARETGRQQDSICLETPAGLVTIQAEWKNGYVYSVTCKTTPAYVVAEGLKVDLTVYGPIEFDLVFSGALYAVVRSEPLGIPLDHAHEPRLIAFASDLITQARPLCEHEHPEMGLLAPLPFVHFEGPEATGPDGILCSSTATYVHPGVICRSPTGTGTAARLALKHKQGRFKVGDALRTTSPRGNSFTGVIKHEQTLGPYPGIVCDITGRAFELARSEIVVDFDDPHTPKDGLDRLLIRKA
jgi:proline racemase